MQKEKYDKLAKEKKVEPGDIISFYFPEKGAIQENGLIVEKVFETEDNGKKIMMARAIDPFLQRKQLEIFKGKANFDRSASYDLDYVTIERKAPIDYR